MSNIKVKCIYCNKLFDESIDNIGYIITCKRCNCKFILQVENLNIVQKNMRALNEEYYNKASKSLLNYLRYYSQDEIALAEQYRHIEDLIGTNKNNQLVGYHCEILARNYIKNHLPTCFSVDTGIVRIPETKYYYREKRKIHADVTIASPQIDILVHNPTEYPPLLKTGEYAIINPEAAKGIIEVKKKINKQIFKDSLLFIDDALRIITYNKQNEPQKFFSGILAYETDISVDEAKDIIMEHHKNGYELPDRIVILTQWYCEKIRNNRLIYHSGKQKSNITSDHYEYCLGLHSFMGCFREKLETTSGKFREFYHLKNPIPVDIIEDLPTIDFRDIHRLYKKNGRN